MLLIKQKSCMTFRIPKQFHIPIIYLTTDIYKIRSDTSGHFEFTITILSYTVGICTLKSFIYQSFTTPKYFLLIKGPFSALKSV